MKGITITMKIEVDLEGVPSEDLRKDISFLEKECRDWQEDMKRDFKSDPELAKRVNVSVEVEEKP